MVSGSFPVKSGAEYGDDGSHIRYHRIWFSLRRRGHEVVLQREFKAHLRIAQIGVWWGHFDDDRVWPKAKIG